jgi:hypothetical protein
MPARSPFPRSADAPLRARLVIGWGLFFAFALIGLWFFVRHGGSVPVLLQAVRP